MASGVYTAAPARDVVRTLSVPSSAAMADPRAPARFTAELTLVASEADLPAAAHVELWRHGRRLLGCPVLLVASASAEGGGCGGAGGTAWTQEVEEYVRSLEVGTWWLQQHEMQTSCCVTVTRTRTMMRGWVSKRGRGAALPPLRGHMRLPREAAGGSGLRRERGCLPQAQP